MNEEQGRKVIDLLRTVVLQLAILLVAVIALLVFVVNAEATTGTARKTDDPNVVELRVKLDITVKRPLERKVFAAGEAVGFAYVERPASKLVRLHRGRNFRTVYLRVRALRHGFIPSPDPARPWLYKMFVPAPVDRVHFWFAHEAPKDVMPLPVAHDTLVDRSAP